MRAPNRTRLYFDYEEGWEQLILESWDGENWTWTLKGEWKIHGQTPLNRVEGGQGGFEILYQTKEDAFKDGDALACCLGFKPVDVISNLNNEKE